MKFKVGDLVEVTPQAKKQFSNSIDGLDGVFVLYGEPWVIDRQSSTREGAWKLSGTRYKVKTKFFPPDEDISFNEFFLQMAKSGEIIE